MILGDIKAAAVIAEKTIVVSLRPESKTLSHSTSCVSLVGKAMLAMLAMYYTFHLQYPKYSEGILTFLQEVILQKNAGTSSVTCTKAYKGLKKACVKTIQ